MLKNLTRRESSEQQLVLDHCPDVLWSYSLEHNRWLYISPSVERLTGYKTGEAMQRTLAQTLSPASYSLFLELTAQRLENFLSSGQETWMSRDELEVLHKDGSHVLCDVTSQCIRNGQGELTLTGVLRRIKDYSRIEQELRASEKKYREILGSLEEGYYECDIAGRITFCNPAACRLFGGTTDEFTGISYKKLYKEPELVYQRFNQVYKTGRPDNGFTAEMIRKDGSILHVEISISPIRCPEGKVEGFRGVARDITERIMFQRQLEYQSMHDQLTGLYNRNYFEEELRRLSKTRDYPISMISADLNGLKLINDTMGHDHGDRLIRAAGELMQKSLRGSDILARVGGDEFAAILLKADERIAEKVIGRIRENINLYSDQNPDVHLSLSLGTSTANEVGITFTELFKQADDRMYLDKFSPSSSARSKIVKSLLAALSERDYIADGHGERLAMFCKNVGEKVGLPDRQMKNLNLLAKVHDLGKVGIPERILFKEGPLDDNEWKIMQQHPEKGHRIALSSNYLSGVANLILKHHERWDGSGYPLGLRGKEIPIECRIFSIADAYDSMTNIRPYSSATPKNEALEELKLCAGYQFDPELVDVFIEVARKL